MDEVRSSRLPARCLVGAAVVGAMWWIGFEGDGRIPVLTYVNLGLHEFGHFVTYAFSDLFTAVMGSVAQIAVPLALAVYFFLFRDDWMAAGLCLAWSATSGLEVAIYVADAPFEELELMGGSHDWAFILGPHGYDAIEQAAPLANTIRTFASLAIATGFLLCVAAALRGAARRAQREPAAAASLVTAASSARAASATSGSAPRSASSPK